MQHLGWAYVVEKKNECRVHIYLEVYDLTVFFPSIEPVTLVEWFLAISLILRSIWHIQNHFWIAYLEMWFFFCPFLRTLGGLGGSFCVQSGFFSVFIVILCINLKHAYYIGCTYLSFHLSSRFTNIATYLPHVHEIGDDPHT